MHCETSIRHYLKQTLNLKLGTSADMTLSLLLFHKHLQNGTFVAKRLWKVLLRLWKTQKPEFS